MAGRITKAQNAESAQIRGSNPFGVSSTSINHDQKLLAGLLKSTTPHHVWARSAEGAKVILPLLERTKIDYEQAEPAVPWNRVMVTYRNKIRAAAFAGVDPKEQLFWRDKARQEAQDRFIESLMSIYVSY